MAGVPSVHAELGALQAELRRSPEPDVKPRSEATDALPVVEKDETARVAVSGAELEETLRELGEALSEHAGSAEEFIAKHPLVSVLAAFTLGIAAGRLIRRT